MVMRVGTAGWSYADWEGVVYPRPKPAGFHALRFLARYIDCMEINSSFYRVPRAEYAARWVEFVEQRPGFTFVAKLHRAFTHDEPRGTQRMEADVADWRRGVEPLAAAGRLAAVLAQFPHSTLAAPRSWGRLEWIARAFGDWNVVVELRHESWFTPEALERLRRLGVSLARIDLPFAPTHPPEDAPPAGEPVGELGYLRLHGRNAEAWFDAKAGRDQRYDWLYSDRDVASIVERARQLAQEHRDTFVVANNHFAGKALANALEIRGALRGEPSNAPGSLVDAYPRLAPKVRVEDEPGPTKQGELFG